MTYLFAAYSVIFVLLAGWILILGKRQNKLIKEISYLQEILKNKNI